jgi:hypothetical protein
MTQSAEMTTLLPHIHLHRPTLLLAAAVLLLLIKHHHSLIEKKPRW